jgi:hypothetical protein
MGVYLPGGELGPPWLSAIAGTTDVMITTTTVATIAAILLRFVPYTSLSVAYSALDTREASVDLSRSVAGCATGSLRPC